MASGYAGDAMGLGEAMIVAGIGCRAGTSAPEIEAAITAALKGVARTDARLDIIATVDGKAQEAGIADAARARGVRLVIVPRHDLDVAAAQAVTRSPRVLALTGLPSVAEAAALAAAGPNARLLAPRVAVGPATCAIAAGGDPT
jgi:cobalt-precorrin 5A hydrolase